MNKQNTNLDLIDHEVKGLLDLMRQRLLRPLLLLQPNVNSCDDVPDDADGDLDDYDVLRQPLRLQHDDETVMDRIHDDHMVINGLQLRLPMLLLPHKQRMRQLRLEMLVM